MFSRCPRRSRSLISKGAQGTLQHQHLVQLEVPPVESKPLRSCFTGRRGHELVVAPDVRVCVIVSPHVAFESSIQNIERSPISIQHTSTSPWHSSGRPLRPSLAVVKAVPKTCLPLGRKVVCNSCKSHSGDLHHHLCGWTILGALLSPPDSVDERPCSC